MSYEFPEPEKFENEELEMEVKNLLDSIGRSGLSFKNKTNLEFWAKNAIELGVSLQQIKEVKNSVDMLMSLLTIYRLNPSVFNLKEAQENLDKLKRVIGNNAIEEEEWMKEVFKDGKNTH